MPSGYTAKVNDGSITEFADFAMLCARAFGATIMMRDDPLDAPIPEFQPSDYNAKRIEEAKKTLNALVEKPEAELRAEWQKEYADEVAYWTKANAEDAKVRERYEAMLAKVEAWEPPSPDHVELKQYMVKQLQESMRFDCHDREIEPQQSFDEWKADKIAKAKRDVQYHRTEHAKEVERTESRNRWVRQLRESLTKERPVSAPIY